MSGDKGQRSCVACGRQAGKSELLRIVRGADGSVSLDVTGRAPGRGAYVCGAECFAQACRKKKLDRALRTTIDADQRERIAAEVQALALKTKPEV